MDGLPLKNIPDHEDVNDNLEKKFVEAWRVAFEVASILKRECSAEEIRITGSLLHRERFHENSDIDLAVTNFTMAKSFDCMDVLEKFNPWKIDIIPLQSLIPEKRDLILQRSVALEV
ncbi:MAG: nucleotidyltransferase domain-containing protein [Chitinivibrionales bacterium]|nr:nucleotidyltransferase domain-containing protein [Chitinivibrionales bacterium]